MNEKQENLILFLAFVTVIYFIGVFVRAKIPFLVIILLFCFMIMLSALSKEIIIDRNKLIWN